MWFNIDHNFVVAQNYKAMFVEEIRSMKIELLKHHMGWNLNVLSVPPIYIITFQT